MKYNEIQCFGRADSGRPRVLDFVGLEHETGPGGHNGTWGNLVSWDFNDSHEISMIFMRFQ